MIRLTRLNNKALAINSDLIKSVENAPDTVITLLNGEKVLVLESIDEVIQRVIAFRRMVLAGICSLGVDSAAIAGLSHAMPGQPQPKREPGEGEDRG